MYMFFEVCHVPGNSKICKNKNYLFDVFLGGLPVLSICMCWCLSIDTYKDTYIVH